MDSLKLTEEKLGNQIGIKNKKSTYQPDEKERDVLQMVLRHFALGYVNMYTPRTEFSDLATIQRAMVDQMSFNTYQPNNGKGTRMITSVRGVHGRFALLSEISVSQSLLTPPLGSSFQKSSRGTHRVTTKKMRRK
jgi:hypothetical protein